MADQTQRKGGRGKKIVLGILVVLVVLVAAVVLAGPSIAGAMAPGFIASAARKQIRGEVTVDRVSLSWTGTQKIQQLRITDPDGKSDVILVDGELDRGLLGLITNPNDLGTLRLSGTIDVVESASGGSNLSRSLEPAPGSTRATGGTGTRPSTPSTPEPLSLPKGFRVAVEGNNLNLKFTRPDGSGATTVAELRNAAVDASVNGADAKLTVTGDSIQGKRALEIRAEALGLIAPDGTVDPSKATITVKADAEAPPGFIETVMGIAKSATDAAGARVSVNLEGRNGRLRLVGDTPARIEGVLPAAMLSRTPASAEGAEPVSFRADGPVTVKLEVRKLDVPLPTSAGLDGVDFRKAVVEAVVSTSAASGELRQGSVVRQVRLDPSTFTFYSIDEVFDLGIGGKMALSLDGVSSGTVMVDMKAAGVLDQDGALRLGDIGKPTGPDFVRAQIRADAVPTALIQPFVNDLGINLNDALGEELRIDLRVGQLGAQAASGAVELDKQLGEEGAAKELAGLPYLAGTLESPHTTVFLDGYLNTDRIQTRNKGLRVETDALMAVLRPFMPKDAGIEVEGQGRGIVEITNLVLPIKSGAVDLRDAHGQFRTIAGDVTASINTIPVGIDSVDVVLALDPGKAPEWQLDARGLYEGKKFAALGSGSVPGVMAPTGAKDAPLGLAPAGARPQGEITLVDVPTGLAKLASTEAATMADAVFGQTVHGVMSSSPAENDAIDVKIRLEGNAATIDGAAMVRKDAIEIGSPGIAVNLAQVGSVLNAANQMSGSDRVSFSPGGKVTVAVTNVNVPLGVAMDVKSLSGAMKVTIAELIGSARKADGSTIPVAIENGTIDGALVKGGAFHATLALNGTAAGKGMSASGGAKGTIPQGGDPAAVAQALDELSLEARNVPTALLGLFDEKTASMAVEAAGDTADITLKPAAPGKKEWTAQVAGTSGFRADSNLKLAGNGFEVGPSNAALTITPALVDAVVGDTLDTMTPRPRLERPVPATASAQMFRVGPSDKGWGIAPDAKIVAQAKASGDIVITNAAQLGEGAPASVGVRGFELNTNTDAAGAGSAAFSGLVFEPGANTPVANVSGDVLLPASPLVGNVRITEGDVAALDKMLAMDGLLVEALGANIGVNAQLEGAGGAVTADVKSPRLTASASLSRGAGGSMTLRKPIEANWKASPVAIDRLVLGAKPGTQPAVRATGDVDVALTVDRFALGPSGTPLQPGVFDLSANIRTGRMALQKATGEKLDFPALTGSVKSEPSTRGVSMQLASAPGETSTVKVVGRVDNLSDPAGKVDANSAVVTADVDGKLPSALVDGAASMNGLLSALVGPTVTVDARADNFGRQAVGGKLDAKVTTENATANIAGQVIAPSVMLVRDGSEVRVTRVTKEASDQIFGVLIPFLTSFEKSDQDEPASVVLNRIEAPLDGNTRNLNGEIVMDLGTMRFETKTFLSELLKIVKQRDAGQIGRKIEPVTFLVNKGIATYTKMIVPVGEFKMESYGTLDLNDRKMDVFVLVPVAALAEEFTSEVSKIPGFDTLTAVPISIKGSFDKPKTKLDLEEMVKRVPGAIAGPEGILGSVLGGVLGGQAADKANDDGSSDNQKKELTPEEKEAKRLKKQQKEEEERLKKEEEQRKKEEKKKKKKEGGG